MQRADVAVGQAAQGGQAAPVIASSGAAALPYIQEVAGRQVTEPPSAAAAQRALASYDRAWTSYTTALRVAAAGSLLASSSGSGSAGGNNGSSAAGSTAQRGAALGPAVFLSGDGQIGVTRALYLEAQLAWNRQASNTLALAARPDLPRPDGETEALAIVRVNQAADLVNQAQARTTAAPSAPVSTQVRVLLDEADQLHHAWVVDWARYLADLG